jgi:hypothetical protein
LSLLLFFRGWRTGGSPQPRTALVVQSIRRTGLRPAYTAANATGHAIPNDGHTFLHVKTGGTGVDVTVRLQGTIDGQAPTSRVVHVSANNEGMLGSYRGDDYDVADDAGASLYVDFSQVVGVTVAAIRL